jgi:putative nucleotidyltransferase with HDIG domain
MDLNESQVRILTATQIAPRLASANRPILDNKFTASRDSGLGQSVQKVVAVTLVTGATPIGMLIGVNKRGRDFDSSDLKLIGSIANQASVFLVNNRLYLLMGVLHALTATIDAKDPYTCGHSQRVAHLSKRLAELCGLGQVKVQQIYVAGLLHDIGKIGVPEHVLCKTGRLTAEEYECIKRHPTIGAKILQDIRQLDEIILGLLTHHERPDGKGYPQGLSGSQVPIEGRIIGLADGFDAMTSDRTYRKALRLEEGLDEIRRNAGTQFDADLVEKFLTLDFEQVMAELHRPTVSQQNVFPFRAVSEGVP